MDEEIEEDGDGVSVSMEISGEYDDVLAKLHAEEARRTDVDPLVADLDVLLETLVSMGGGTRSAIAQELPEGTTVPFDAEAVVDTLQVLERYDLVVLEGNTWKPGPKLQE